jgi:hypothetical protein
VNTAILDVLDLAEEIVEAVKVRVGIDDAYKRADQSEGEVPN